MIRKEFILVAEDDLDDRFMLQTVFEEKEIKARLEFVNNGLELISYLKQIKEDNGILHYPKFILLDLNMPKMDGRQTLLEIKNDPEYKKIPVIIFSTTNNEVEINRCYELGANTYVVKPSNYTNFLTSVDTIVTYWLHTAAIPYNNMV